MNRPPLFFLIAVGLLLLLPAGAGRVLLDPHHYSAKITNLF